VGTAVFLLSLWDALRRSHRDKGWLKRKEVFVKCKNQNVKCKINEVIAACRDSAILIFDSAISGGRQVKSKKQNLGLEEVL